MTAGLGRNAMGVGGVAFGEGRRGAQISRTLDARLRWALALTMR